MSREIEPKIMRLNFPRLVRRFPRLPDAYGRWSAMAALVMGTVFGVAAIVGGIIVALR